MLIGYISLKPDIDSGKDAVFLWEADSGAFGTCFFTGSHWQVRSLSETQQTGSEKEKIKRRCQKPNFNKLNHLGKDYVMAACSRWRDRAIKLASDKQITYLSNLGIKNPPSRLPAIMAEVAISYAKEIKKTERGEVQVYTGSGELDKDAVLLDAKNVFNGNWSEDIAGFWSRIDTFYRQLLEAEFDRRGEYYITKS